MEFQIWGKLDEDGRMQTIQSSCSHALEQSPAGVQRTSPTHGEWAVSRLGESPGEELLSVDEKKKLVYQLDSKIDEMSCMMVRLGDLTNTLNYQEKLINEYEDRMRRQEQDIQLLRADNMLLRQGKMAKTDLHISSASTSVSASTQSSALASLSIQTAASSSELSSNTFPKSVRSSFIEMTCSVKCTSNEDQTQVKYPSWPTVNTRKSNSPESISDLKSGENEFVNIREKRDKLDVNVHRSAHEHTENVFENDQDALTSNGAVSESGVCKLTCDLESKENDAIHKDKIDDSKCTLNDLSAVDTSVNRHSPDTNTPGNASLDTVDGFPQETTKKLNSPIRNNHDTLIGAHKPDGNSPTDTVDGFTQENAMKASSPVQMRGGTLTCTRHKVAPKPPRIASDIDAYNHPKTTNTQANTTHRDSPLNVTSKLEMDGSGYLILGKPEYREEDVHGTWLSVTQSLRPASRGKAGDAREGPLEELDGPTRSCCSSVTSNVQLRFTENSVKTQETRRAVSHDGYNSIQDDQIHVLEPPTLPARPKTLAVLSKQPSEPKPGMKSSPGSEKRKDDTFNCVMKTMRTTMEWNKARKTLMKKSTACTVDMVERSLGQLVQDMCNTLASLKDKKHTCICTPLSPRKIAKLRKALRNCHDEDIMTEEFLRKCSDLYLSN